MNVHTGKPVKQHDLWGNSYGINADFGENMIEAHPSRLRRCPRPYGNEIRFQCGIGYSHLMGSP